MSEDSPLDFLHHTKCTREISQIRIDEEHDLENVLKGRIEGARNITTN